MLKVERGACPGCKGNVLVVTGDAPLPRYFNPLAVPMLVVLAYPVPDTAADDKRQVALGPCQLPPHPLYHPGEVPVAYLGHLIHICGGPNRG